VVFDRHAVDGGEHLVDAHVAQLAVDHAQPRGCGAIELLQLELGVVQIVSAPGALAGAPEPGNAAQGRKSSESIRFFGELRNFVGSGACGHAQLDRSPPVLVDWATSSPGRKPR
jgi:hypothetical protein